MSAKPYCFTIHTGPSTSGRTQVNKALHTCTFWSAYAAMFSSSEHTWTPHSADLSMHNRQTVTFVSPSLSRVLSVKTSSLHATVQGLQALRFARQATRCVIPKRGGVRSLLWHDAILQCLLFWIALKAALIMPVHGHANTMGQPGAWHEQRQG